MQIVETLEHATRYDPGAWRDAVKAFERRNDRRRFEAIPDAAPGDPRDVVKIFDRGFLCGYLRT